MVATLGLLLSTRSGASAHVCATPIRIEPEVDTSITVGVPAEEVRVDGVTVEVPDGFRVSGIPGAPGWTAQKDGRSVRFTGSSIAVMACTSFTIAGRAERPGTLFLPYTTHLVDGRTVRHDDRTFGPTSAQLVAAGVDAPGSDDGGPPKALLGVAAVVVFGGGLAIARRRARGPVSGPPPRRR